MDRRFELTSKLSAALLEIEQHESSSVAADPSLLNALADYIESGTAASTTLQQLRTVLQQTEPLSALHRNGSGAADSAEDAGKQRAQRLLAEVLKERYGS